MRAVVAITPPRCTEPRLFWQASASSEEARQRRHLVLGTDLRQRPPQYLRRGGTVMNDDDATGAHALAEEGSGEGVEPSTVRRERFEQRVPATNAVCGTTNAWRVDGANGIAPFEHTARSRRAGGRPAGPTACGAVGSCADHAYAGGTTDGVRSAKRRHRIRVCWGCKSSEEGGESRPRREEKAHGKARCAHAHIAQDDAVTEPARGLRARATGHRWGRGTAIRQSLPTVATNDQ